MALGTVKGRVPKVLASPLDGHRWPTNSLAGCPIQVPDVAWIPWLSLREEDGYGDTRSGDKVELRLRPANQHRPHVGPELVTAVSLRNPEPNPGPDPFVSLRFPPSFPRPAGGLSGRPFCRIYFRRQVWVLELERSSGGWIEFGHGDHTSRPFEPLRLHFASLAAAIAYAEGPGFDYRVVPAPSPRRRWERTGRGGASRAHS